LDIDAITAMMSSGDPAQVAQAVELLRAVPELYSPVATALTQSVHSLDDLLVLTADEAQAQRYRCRFARHAAERAAQRLPIHERAAILGLLDRPGRATLEQHGRRVFDVAQALHAATQPPSVPPLAFMRALHLTRPAVFRRLTLGGEDVEERFLLIARHHAIEQAQVTLEDSGLPRVMRERIASSAREGAVRAASDAEREAMLAVLRRLAGELLAERMGR
jgi:hypothetical protein